MLLSQCALDGKWCCGELLSEECCTRNDRFGLAVSVGSTSSSTSGTLLKSTSSTGNQGSNPQPTVGLDSAFTSSLTPISTPTSTPTYSPSHSQTGKSAGIGAGTGVAILVIGVVVYRLVVRRQRHRRARENQYQQRPLKQKHDMVYEMPKYGSNETPLAQSGNESRFERPEIDGANRHEIDGASLPGRHDNYIR